MLPLTMIYKYGIEADDITPLELEYAAFRLNPSPDLGGLGRYQHLKNASKILFPDIEWNPWTERLMDAACENQWLALSGCASSGKTWGETFYAVNWWLAGPVGSTVILTSTTGKMIRKRAWPVIQQLYNSRKGMPGNLVDSKTTWQARKGDDLNAIFAIPVAEGETQKAIANIQGLHNRRVLVIIDEATDTPEAIFKVCMNLSTGCDEFQLIMSFNPVSRFDLAGIFSEPKDGWASVTVDTDEWEIKPQMNGKGGKCIRFDGTKSPNILAGRTLYPYLIDENKVNADKKHVGESHPNFWKWTRGFWAPDGLTKTVFSEAAILKHNGTGQFIFTGRSTFIVAFCDPAFGGGDRPVLYFAKVGEVEGGKMAIQLMRYLVVPLDSKSSNPIHYQLAEAIRRECENYRENGQSSNPVAPHHFGLDASGEGGGLADILARTWNPNIRRVEFGGRPSDLPVSNEDVRPCSDVYDRKVTEIWFTAREYLLAGQLRGLTPDVIAELTRREFSDEKRKIKIETKTEMKLRMGGVSPDLADAVCGLCQVVKLLGITVEVQGETAQLADSWNEQVKQLNKVYEDVCYAPEEEFCEV